MDSPETDRKKPRITGLLRFSCALIFTLSLFLSASSVIVLFSILIGNYSISDPISIPSQCKIVSSSKFLPLICSWNELFMFEFWYEYAWLYKLGIVCMHCLYLLILLLSIVECVCLVMKTRKLTEVLPDVGDEILNGYEFFLLFYVYVVATVMVFRN